MSDKDILLDSRNAVIEHNNYLGGQKRPVLCDKKDHEIWTFPVGWTQEQIMVALEFANHAYDKGVKVGMKRKQEEIKKVLGV